MCYSTHSNRQNRRKFLTEPTSQSNYDKYMIVSQRNRSRRLLWLVKPLVILVMMITFFSYFFSLISNTKVFIWINHQLQGQIRIKKGNPIISWFHLFKGRNLVVININEFRTNDECIVILGNENRNVPLISLQFFFLRKRRYVAC